MRAYLKSQREKKNLPQAKLAELLGVSSSCYCLIENGKRGISLEMLVRIATILQVKSYKLAMEEIKYINRGA